MIDLMSVMIPFTVPLMCACFDMGQVYHEGSADTASYVQAALEFNFLRRLLQQLRRGYMV